MNITALDHLVLTVADVARSIDFYTRVLGMEAITFGEGRKALRRQSHDFSPPRPANPTTQRHCIAGDPCDGGIAG